MKMGMGMIVAGNGNKSAESADQTTTVLLGWND